MKKTDKKNSESSFKSALKKWQKASSGLKTGVTDDGILLDPLYYPEEDTSFLEKNGFPGQYPFTRGVYPSMYLGRPWTMRQYSGYGTVEDTNTRFKYLIENGTSGLSVAFDLPTQMGRDSDDPMAEGEVGRVGVAIDTVEDMERLFQDIPIEKVSTSMTINATAHILLAFYLVVAERRGIPYENLRGTVQNDILKEYIARGTYIYPPKAGLKISTDIIDYCSSNVPNWNTISISGYHIREAGSTAAQEIGITLQNGLTYIESVLSRGLSIDDFAPRLSFFFNCHNNFFEEVSKFRAARRLWAKLIKEKYNPQNEKSMMLRFHTQTAGSSLTAQQPYNNVVRTSVQALAAVMGGTQSLHTNSYDEALSLPSEEAALLALRTQQVIKEESGVSSVIDPLGGSYFIEKLTDEIEQKAIEIMDTLERSGGMIQAIEKGTPQGLIEDAAYRYQKDIEQSNKNIVGINCHTENSKSVTVPKFTIDPLSESSQIKKLEKRKGMRDQSKLEAAKKNLNKAAQNNDNIMPAVIELARLGGSLGEISSILRDVHGSFKG